MFLLLGLIVAITTWIRARLVKRFGLMCPTCGCGLIDKERRRKALVTGHCPKCRSKMFDEEPFSPRSGYLDREEFKAKLTAGMRRNNRETIRLLIILFAAMIACAATANYFQRLIDRGGLDWVTPTGWRKFAGLMLGMVCVVAVGVFILAFRGKFKVPASQPCPECGRSIAGVAGKIAIKTGICIYCGCRLFEEPSSDKA